jgi:hypothetical protein
MLIALFLPACSKSEPDIKPAPAGPEPSVQTFKADVDFRVISFRSDESVFSQVKAEVMPATPLESPDDKPEDNWPEHARFSFAPPAHQTTRQTYFDAELRIVDLAAYRDAYKVSPEYVEGLDQEIQKLKELIDRGTASGSELPFLPFVDAHQSLWVHLKRVDFAGGKGIAFVTQYVFEPIPINNQGLTWIYQGLTDDGGTYVLATFPVRSSVASDADDPDTPHRGYRASDGYGQTEGHRRAYETYLAGVKKALDAARPSGFEPNLEILEKIIGSLRLGK